MLCQTKKGQYMVLLRRTATKEFGGSRREIKIVRWLGREWRLPYHIPAWINEQIKDEVTHWMPLPKKPKEDT
jgi:hypothetical protein